MQRQLKRSKDLVRGRQWRDVLLERRIRVFGDAKPGFRVEVYVVKAKSMKKSTDFPLGFTNVFKTPTHFHTVRWKNH